MKKINSFILLLVILLFSVSASASVYWLRKGDKAIVSKRGQWVDVENFSPVKTGQGWRSRGDSCILELRGEIRIAEVQKDVVLVRYKAPFSGAAYGTQCPSGVLFFVEKKIFSDMMWSH